MVDIEQADAGRAAAASLSHNGVPRTLLIAGDLPPNLLPATLPLAGSSFVGYATNAAEAAAVAAQEPVDVALVVLPALEAAELQFCRQLHGDLKAPIVLMLDEVEPGQMERALETGLHGIVSRTTPPAIVSAMLLLAARRHAAQASLVAERDRLAEQTRQLLGTLENRKLIERAKGIYMRVLGLQEADAHKRLQQESQRRRLAIADLARKVIESDELLGAGY